MKIQKWKDLVNVFIKQYKYYMDIVPDRSSLQDMKIGDREFIREYTHRCPYDKNNEEKTPHHKHYSCSILKREVTLW